MNRETVGNPDLAAEKSKEFQKAVAADVPADLLGQLETLSPESVRKLKIVVENLLLKYTTVPLEALRENNPWLATKLESFSGEQLEYLHAFLVSLCPPAPTEMDVNRAETHPKKTAFGLMKKFFREKFDRAVR